MLSTYIQLHTTTYHLYTMRLGDLTGFDMLSVPHYGEFDFMVCQIPTIAPPMPEGG